MRNILAILMLGLLFTVACEKDKRTEDQQIDDFIAENNLEGEFMTDGIFVSIENPGNGEHPTATSTVLAYYEGKYVSDSERFDGNLSRIEPLAFSLQQVIPGWTKGIPYFGVGDKGWIILPASQGYGNFPPSGIRNNAALAFYIELEGIEQ